ncbi:type VII secretion protein EccCa [Mycobacterium sp. Y57]|uniref:type VII secretion protein EccCa n=1 Tax=Mycolicibacterium xanthum TaxID=2796469 RepID=UPI001C85FB30|nr:type VII secretion protein EccCa [Mycolicibacterium xanthum]MBX7432179.1 type VII secretion protein EccCa [Mycolicibacterium xanthum]
MATPSPSPTGPPESPGGRLVIDPPPESPEPVRMHPLARLMPLAVVVAALGMSAVYLTSGAARSPTLLFFPVMMLASALGTLAYGARGAGRTVELNERRAGYLRYLATQDAVLAESAARQHRLLHWRNPDPRALWTLAGRMWERCAADPDFASVRVGLGQRPAATAIVAPDIGSDEGADPVTTGALRRLVRERSAVAGVPLTIPLTGTREVMFGGAESAARAAARALVCQLAALHPPGLIGIELATEQGRRHWDWLKWLPHVVDPGAALRRIVIVDGGGGPEPDDSTTTVVIGAVVGPVRVCADSAELDVACDALSLADAAACARRIAGHRPARGVPVHGSAGPDWPALMGLDPESIDVDRLWNTTDPRRRLRVPIGVAEDGAAVELDLKEAAAGGMGPHGLCIGATGSGKSEFLRTLTLGLIAAHSPDTLNLVLVDFKGGATFLGLEGVHHVSAVITNLADEAHLVARMRDALTGEVNRRQEILRAAGNLANITDYTRARIRDPALAPLPSLVIVVDEFSELLSQHPDFAELFVAIGRLGRSLGMHLLLASQRLDEGRLRGLDTHLSYRICLKTFSAAESRAVLGVPDAYHLPTEPGAAYLKTATGALTRFQTAFVSGDLARRRSAGGVAPQRFTLADVRRTAESGSPCTPHPVLLDEVLGALAGRGPRAHRVWLPPLSRSPQLSALLSARPTPQATLCIPVGVVDCPYEQRYEPRIVDLSGAAGNLVVVGAPRSGKSTTLQTVISGLAATHDAGQVRFYGLDLGGGALTELAGLPHVGSVAGRADTELCRRTVAALQSLLRRREDGAEARDGHVFLVVDGWAALREDLENLEASITALAARGLAYGIHVMIAASRWADLRPALKDQIGTRIELRLGDPADSEMDRRSARRLTGRPPGRGLTPEGREMAIALPDLDRLRHNRTGRPAPPIELLPTRVAHAEITRPDDGAGVLLGVGEHDLGPVAVDFAEHPHLLVLGEGECGKTSALRVLCAELVASRSPERVQLEIVDYRRTLLGVVETAHLGGYAVSPTALASRMSVLTERLTARMPDERVTQRQLRDRSWWDGPDIFLVVDDYDLVAGATGNPLTPIADFLPHAKDLGLHVVVARRSGGAARAMFDPVLARMRDMGTSGLMMSAAPDEGVLLGTSRPAPLPPGRGILTVRGRPDELLQIGWIEPP